MNRNFIFKSITILVFLVLNGCKSVTIEQESQKITSQNIMLGAIGEDKSFILEKDYNHTALPKLDSGIKVQVNVQDFNKSTHKAFTKAATSQNTELTINYVDSVSIKPRFLKLELSDRVEILNALNGESNKDIKAYITNKNDAHITTAVSMALPSDKMEQLITADEVLLEASGIKSYALKTYKNGQLQTTINFNQGVIFAYQASNFCWKENDKYQLEIVDIVEGTDKCPNKTYRTAKRAKKKIDYYKF